MNYVKVLFFDAATGHGWTWRMREEVAHERAAEHVAAWARDGQTVTFEVTRARDGQTVTFEVTK